MSVSRCLSVEEIALVAAGEGTDLVAHADSCEACRAAIAAAIRAARSTEPDRETKQADELASRVRIGRYVIAELLGEGGMGRVYAAYDPELARTIALKVLRAAPSPDALTRLSREARLAAQLSHPNVVSVYDLGRHGAQVYIAMELVAGETLRAWLAAKQRSWQDIVDAFVQAGNGLVAAHAAGVVHRDIKPDNIFVGRDGRVRIGDFGLARLADDAPVPATGEVPEPNDSITRTGTVLGTVSYMAPEQRDGTSDERSDQYAFCVSLYEALHGARPPAAKRADIPRWVDAVVTRGLATAPAERFPSMQALVSALAADPRQRRRRVALGAAVVLGIGTLATTTYVRGGSDPCSDAPAEIAEVWSAQQAAKLGAAWAATTVPNAKATWERIVPALDRHAASWANGARAACRATRIDRSQSEALLELRTICLDRRKQELATVVEALRDPAPAIVERAVKLVDDLEPVAQCSNLDALRAPVPPPRDTATAIGVRDVQAQLRQVEIALRTARLAGIGDTVKAIVDRAVALGYEPTVAEAWTKRAEVAAVLGDAKAAEAAYYEALWAAEAGRDRRAIVVAWSGLLQIVGDEGALDEGLKLFNHADAALRGLGEDDRLRAQVEVGAAKLFRDRGDYTRATTELERARRAMASAPDEGQLFAGTLEATAGTIAYAMGKYDDALAHYQKAHDLRVKALGPNHPDVARAIIDLGNIYKDRNDYARATEQYNRAWDLLKASVPPDHPMVGAVRGNLALVLMEEKQYDAALEHQHAALAILEHARGPEHPEVGLELNNIGLTLTYAKRPSEAIPYFERARNLFVKALGPSHFDVAMIEHNLGLAYMDLQDDAKAEAHFRASIAIREKVAPEHPELARTYSRLAALMTRSNRFDLAVELLQRAIAIYDKVHGPTNPILSKPLLDLGWTLNQQKKYADAIAPLERVVPIHEAMKSPLVNVSRLELATALWETHRDRPRAVELAKLVKQSIDPRQADDVREIDAWLAKHRL